MGKYPIFKTWKMNLNISDSDFQPLITYSDSYKKGFLCAGPCAVESPEQILAAARALTDGPIHLLRGGVWKPRTRPNGFQGLGKAALGWLKSAGESTGLPVAAEVASPQHLDLALKAGIDVVWIGARTSVNPFAVQDIADALKGVNIGVMVKNPIIPDPLLWLGAIERLYKAGIPRLAAVHRGFFSLQPGGYRNPPQWRVPLELKRRLPNLPLFCDPSHICGSRNGLLAVAQEALDLLFDGFMFEVHPDPDSALSDTIQQLTPEAYIHLINRLELKSSDSVNSNFRQELERLRLSIDAVDEQLIELLAQRMALSRRIGQEKMAHGISFYQPRRWQQLLTERCAEGARKGLVDDFIIKLYDLIHEESLRLQRQQPITLMPEPALCSEDNS